MLRTEDTPNLTSFGRDVIDGLVPKLKQGPLCLVEEMANSQEPEMTSMLGVVEPGDKRKFPEAIEAH
jgi:hypothetical protein